MTTFAGWIGYDTPSEQAQSLLHRQTAGDGTLTPQTGRNYALTAQAGYSLHEGGYCVVTPQAGCNEQERKNLLHAYRQRGGGCLSGYSDPAALIVIDEAEQTLLLAADPIGLSHLYYAQTPQGLVFGSSADAVVRHPAVSNAISPQSLYDYVYFHHCPSPDTIYQQVKKLEGGQCLLYQKGQVRLTRYWLPEFHEPAALNIKQAGQELQALLIAAVKRLAADEETTGAFLSGGLDSSSVAGALSAVFPGKAKTFTMGFPVAEYNEMEYATIAASHFNTRQHEYYVTAEDTFNAVPAIAAYYDEPFGNSSALAAYYCAKLAKQHGVSRLLAGDGGDEIFAGNERYAKQMLFEYYHRMPGFLAAGLESCLKHLPPQLAKQTIPFKASRYIEQAKAAMPDRLQEYNYLHRHAVSDIFNADFLLQVDRERPLQQLRDSYHRPQQASTLNRMMYMDWKTTLHDNDLVKVNRMCQMAGVEVCYPLLDQKIIELSCRIASADKLKGQKLRWFYKQAMGDFLPERIINKPKHGFGLPFGVWLKDHQPLKDLAYDAINGLKQREYFKSEFLDHAVNMHQTIHAPYYGELIWVLMMLELWFIGKKGDNSTAL
jgi:asparagine synthase (glutamine-hydrolysing)